MAETQTAAGTEIMAPPPAAPPAPAPQQRTAVHSSIPVYDSAAFAHMQRIAQIMANSPVVPASLRGVIKNKDLILFEYEERFANCFQIVNQAHNWGMDPFAVAQACSIVHGRLMYEGKLVYAVIQAKLGIRLTFEWNDKTGDAFGITVRGPSIDGMVREISGTVGQWQTTGEGSPWKKASQARMQLAYRGSRDWCRLYEPALLLGVYTPDELADITEDTRARNARDVTPRSANFLADDDSSGPVRLPTSAAANASLSIDPATGEVLAGDEGGEPEAGDDDAGQGEASQGEEEPGPTGDEAGQAETAAGEASAAPADAEIHFPGDPAPHPDHKKLGAEMQSKLRALNSVGSLDRFWEAEGDAFVLRADIPRATADAVRTLYETRRKFKEGQK